MKARITKKLKGTIVLSSISNKSMVADQAFEITDEQYWADDIQSALRKGWVICNDAPKSPKTVTITNVSLGSISVPGAGVLHSGKSAEIPVKLADSLDIERLVKSKKLAMGSKKVAAIDPKPNFVVYEPETEATSSEAKAETEAKPPATEKKRSSKKPKSDIEDMLIDTSSPSNDEKDIKWVDHEETQRRIDSHPGLKNRDKK